MTEKERAYKDHLQKAHNRNFDARCAPLLCDDCEHLWGIWCMELLHNTGLDSQGRESNG